LVIVLAVVPPTELDFELVSGVSEILRMRVSAMLRLLTLAAS
jgi:hypothetical protein